MTMSGEKALTAPAKSKFAGQEVSLERRRGYPDGYKEPTPIRDQVEMLARALSLSPEGAFKFIE